MNIDENAGETRSEINDGERDSACEPISSDAGSVVPVGNGVRISGKEQAVKKKREKRPIVPNEPFIPKSRHLKKLTMVALGMCVTVRELSGCQIRNKHIDPATVERYLELLTISDPPNIVIIKDVNGRMYIADGHNRVAAAIRAGKKYIIADVYEGTMADARIVGLELNQGSLPMTTAERSAMLNELLDNPDLDYSTLELAAMTAMSKTTVDKRKKERSEGDFLSTVNGMKRPKTAEEKLTDAVKSIIRQVEKTGTEAMIRALDEMAAHIREDVMNHLTNNNDA